VAKSRHIVLVLLSGGLDSTSCLSYYKRRGNRVTALFVDYGHKASKRESAAAHTVAREQGIALASASVDGLRIPGGAIPGRNALLLDVALMSFGRPSGIVALGIHAGTDYPDCSSAFVAKMQAVFDVYTGGRIRIDAPFLKWRKRDIYDFAIAQKLPIGLTYSCETGGKLPCGSCTSCKDIEALHVG
jgi:7-cyano-7-deazaguanine synthase